MTSDDPPSPSCSAYNYTVAQLARRGHGRMTTTGVSSSARRRDTVTGRGSLHLLHAGGEPAVRAGHCVRGGRGGLAGPGAGGPPPGGTPVGGHRRRHGGRCARRRRRVHRPAAVVVG